MLLTITGQDCGVSATVASNANPGGQVNVYFHPVVIYGTTMIEVAGNFSYDAYPDPNTPTTTYQWSYYGGSQLGTSQTQTVYVDSPITLQAEITTVGNVQRTGTLAITWDPIASASVGQMDDGEEPCIWIGAPLAPDGYDPGGAPPYIYQWSSSDGALSQTDTTSNTQDTAYFYDYNDDPPNGPSSVTVYLTVSDTGTQASASQYVSSYDCPKPINGPRCCLRNKPTAVRFLAQRPCSAALKPRSQE